MDDLSIFYFFKMKTIDASVEFHGNLQRSIKEMIDRSLSATGKNAEDIGPIMFKMSSDARIHNLEYEMCYPGRTISDAIVKVENEFPVIFAVTPTEDNGYEITLEYNERRFEDV